MGIEQKLAELVPEDGSASEDEDDSRDEAASWDARDAVARLVCLVSLYERGAQQFPIEDLETPR
jgi:hypothetical protein